MHSHSLCTTYTLIHFGNSNMDCFLMVLLCLSYGGTTLSVKSITYSKSSAATVGMKMSGTTLSESTAKVST